MRLALLLSYGAVFWVVALLAAPLLVASGSSAPATAGVVVYRAASVVCHQLPERSFYLASLPLAVCARCFGLYVGAAVASVTMMGLASGVQRPGSRVPSLAGPGSRAGGRSPGPDKRGLWTLGLGPRTRLAVAALPTAVTWGLERSGLWMGGNGVRFVAAVPLGLAAAWIVLAALRAERPDTID